MAHKLINIDTCRIERQEQPTSLYPTGVIKVFDEEGDERYLFPAVLADAEVKYILREINHAYDKGYDVGSASRARTICDALGFKREMLEDR